MNNRADGVRVAFPLFQEEGSGSTPTSALQLRFGTVDVDTAIALNRLWHSRLPKLNRSNLTRNPNKAYFGAEFDGLYYAVAVWTNPVARLLCPKTIMELRRLAIAPDAPKNTASRMLGWMVRDIKKRFPQIAKLVSYQDLEVHNGTIYKAAGWTTIHRSSGDDWVRPNRKRNRTQSDGPKQRWEKVL